MLQCVHIPDGGFRRGNYRCMCPSSRHQAAAAPTNTSDRSPGAGSGFDGAELERLYVNQLLVGTDVMPQCSRCDRGCLTGSLCSEDRSCYADYDILLRGIPMGIQSLCVTVAIVLTIVVVRLRKTKVI